MDNLVELISNSYSLSSNPQAKENLLNRLGSLSESQKQEISELLLSEKDQLKKIEEQYSDEKALLDAQFVNKSRILLTQLTTAINREKEAVQNAQDDKEAEAALNALE